MEQLEQKIQQDEFVSMLGKCRQPVSIRMQSCDELIKRGLRYFLGEKARWLPEYNKVSQWLSDNGQRGLLLFGANGRGKSLMCRDILPVLIKYYMHNVKVYVARAIDLRNAQPDKNEYYSMRGADILFVDDFGVESITNSYGEKRDVFSDVVDVAEHDRKILVCSTNLSPQEIGQRYGLRTLDRLRALTVPVCFEGDSLRGRNFTQ